MGVTRDQGYSASVSGYFRLADGVEHDVVKTNSSSFVLIQPIQLPPGATGVLVIIVDETRDSTRVVLPEGAALGQPRVRYEPLS